MVVAFCVYRDMSTFSRLLYSFIEGIGKVPREDKTFWGFLKTFCISNHIYSYCINYLK